MKKQVKKDNTIDIIRDRFKQIIYLTTIEDDDGIVWGKDTECGKIEDLIDRAWTIMTYGR